MSGGYIDIQDTDHNEEHCVTNATHSFVRNARNSIMIKRIKEKELKVELSFIITFHKLQGKTFPKLIIQPNERPFLTFITYNGFLVALSLVKFGSHF
jgi:ATP-dependent exoDNAse (exonuclease V) alpha subunit